MSRCRTTIASIDDCCVVNDNHQWHNFKPLNPASTDVLLGVERVKLDNSLGAADEENHLQPTNHPSNQRWTVSSLDDLICVQAVQPNTTAYKCRQPNRTTNPFDDEDCRPCNLRVTVQLTNNPITATFDRQVLYEGFLWSWRGTVGYLG